MSFFHNSNFAHYSFTKDKITDLFHENIAEIMDMSIDTFTASVGLLIQLFCLIQGYSEI